MEVARCQLCGAPMSSWLEVCGDLCVCMKCAGIVTLSDLSGAGFAKVKPDTYQMNGNILVTMDTPDVILDYAMAKQQLSAIYGMKVSNVDANRNPYECDIDEIVNIIHKLGFATESAFFAYCDSLREGGYTSDTSYSLRVCDRYCELCVVDEIGTTCNYLEGQTRDEAIALFIEGEKAFEEEHPEYKFGTPEQKAMLEAQKSLVTKESVSETEAV